MGKDDATWLNICYAIFGIIVAYVGYKAIFTVGLQQGWTERYDEWFPTINVIGAMLVGAGCVYWLQSDNQRRDYHESAIAEVRKVAWPSPEDTKRMTIIVAVVVAVFAVILTIFDVVWSRLFQWIIA